MIKLLIALSFYCGFLSQINADGSYEIDDDCLLGNGKYGTCTTVATCPRAVIQIRTNGRHNLKQCGFLGKQEVVCCDTAVIRPNTGSRSMLRKSDAECEEYAKLVPSDIRRQVSYGENAELGEFPHMAALGYKFDGINITWGYCGGSLISNEYVLTAAHCAVNIYKVPPSVVRLGKIDLLGTSDKTPPKDYEVRDVTVHGGYNISTKVNDIALIQLIRLVEYQTNISPCCLYTKTDNPTGLVITGWGLTMQDGKGSQILQKSAQLPVDHATCNRTFLNDPFPKAIIESQLCAKSNDSIPRDTCLGDSGGPIQVLTRTDSDIFSVVGVTSFGRGCGNNRPGVYTRVSSYLDWIEGIVWP